MTTMHGFELIQERDIAEINSKVQFLRHVKTGAELLSVQNDDENKFFGITFRTPPSDSTGLPHIMEHAVLCGSRKYPVKEPFVELMKGSLNTFLNALTYPDKTCYPVASQNLQDFYNLVDVYLDAVLYPRNTRHILEQEGWHYELENLQDPLTFKGVVFNEMKGAYSSPDNLLGRYSQQSLFPENTYGVDSGGDPSKIPDLTYAQFVAFHQTYYHPSNARIFFYGDDDHGERLRLLDTFLRDFEPIDPGSTVPLHPRFEEPRTITRPYSASADENKAMLTVNWMLNEPTDPVNTLSLGILSYILVGTPASPLRKALIDSGLGEDLTSGGVDSDLRQMMFSTGLKGIALTNAGEVESLILQTLDTLAREGIDPDMIEAAVNTIEFSLRENNTGFYPRGMLVMLRALSAWLYGGDPLAPLAFEAPLATIKTHLADGAPYFEDLIRRHLVQNPHRTTVILKPDPELNQRQEAAETERLAQARAAMSEEQLQAIIENTRQLKLRQSTPDSPEALATIPTLTLADLDKENKHIPLEIVPQNGTQVLYHDLFTNGIIYLDVGFDLRTLPQELIPYVPLFGQALVKIGTEEQDFVKLLQRIGSKTGGIAPATLTSAIQGSPEGATWLFLRSKSTTAQADDLLDILRDVLLTVKLDNPARFSQMVLEAKAKKEAGLIPGGHSVINTRLRAHFDRAGWAAEQMRGVSNLFFLRQLAQDVKENWPAVLDKLETIRRTLINRNNTICNVTLDGANWAQFQPRLAGFLDTLPVAPAPLAQWSPQPAPAFQGLTIPAQINYVGKAANLYEMGYQLHGSMSVIANYVRATWLWERVRLQGGAYGSFFVFDRRSGVLSYLSYRDPNLLDTLDSYDQTAEFLRQLDLSEDELVKSIIGAIGQIDAYQLPDAKGYTSMVRYLAGDTDAMRQRLRDQVLSTTVADFRALAEVLEQVKHKGRVVVLGAQETIEAANATREGWLEVQKVL
jgi:Zn-dependent M16 (insulinase) family peptidase